MSSKSALILIDYINEIVTVGGKLAGKGYVSFDAAHGSLDHAAILLDRARQAHALVIHVRVGFSADYREHPAGSPLLGSARKFGALQCGTWGTEFHAKVQPAIAESVLLKHRVSAFHGTPLELILRGNGISAVYLSGVATDLAVQSAARDAHDRDFQVNVVADTCIAANDEDHASALKTLAKIATIVASTEITLE